MRMISDYADLPKSCGEKGRVVDTESQLLSQLRIAKYDPRLWSCYRVSGKLVL